MSTNDNPKPQPKTIDEQIDSSIVNLGKLIERKVKAEGMTPEFTFGQKVADGVKKNWESGTIPSADEVKDEALGLAGLKSVTTGVLVNKAIKIMTRALYLSKIDSAKAKLKKDNPNLSDNDLTAKLVSFAEQLDKTLADRVKKTPESTSKS